MAWLRRPSSKPKRHDDDLVRVALLRQRSRSRAIVVVLLCLGVLFYGQTVARLGQHTTNVQTASGPPP